MPLILSDLEVACHGIKRVLGATAILLIQSYVISSNAFKFGPAIVILYNLEYNLWIKDKVPIGLSIINAVFTLYMYLLFDSSTNDPFSVRMQTH